MVMRMRFSASQQFIEELCEHCNEVVSDVHISEITYLHPDSDYASIKVSTGSISDTPSIGIQTKTAKIEAVKLERHRELMLTASAAGVTESLKYLVRSEKMCSSSNESDVPEFCYRVDNPKFLTKTIGTLSVSESFHSGSVIRNDITGGFKIGSDRRGNVVRIKSESINDKIVYRGAWRKNWFLEIEKENPALAKQLALTESFHRLELGKFLEEFQYREGFEKPSAIAKTGSVYDNTRSILFDGVDDFIDLGDTEDYYHYTLSEYRDHGVTVAAWVYITTGSLASGYPILSIGRTHNKFYGMRCHVNPQMKLQMDFMGQNGEGGSFGQTANHRKSRVSTTTIETDQWHFLTWAFKTDDEDDWHIYHNGYEIPSTKTGNEECILTYNGDSSIGKLGKTNESAEKFMNGNISNLGIWSTNVGEAGILSIYNDGNPLNYQTASFKYIETGSLVGYWQMEEGSGIHTANSALGGRVSGSLKNGAGWSTVTQNNQLPSPIR